LTQIGIFSDTHGFFDESLIEHFSSCHEIWHIGDFGPIETWEHFVDGFHRKKLDPVFRGVFGNIDGYPIRSAFPEQLDFTCEGVSVLMQHIGGYPGRYAPGIKKSIADKKARLFLSGHSHILKIQFDNSLNCLHINPGAAGHHGWHTERTAVRLVIDGSDMRNCEVIELGKRGRLNH
jgi:predicted phosphodiesterase